MSVHPPRKNTPRRRSLRRAIAIGLAILAGTILGGLTPHLLAWIYGSALVRYSIATCLLALTAWLVLRIIRTWNDPYAQMLKHFSFLLPLFLVIATAGVLTSFGHQRFDRFVFSDEKVPDDVWQALRSPGQMALYSIYPSPGFQFDDAGNPLPASKSEKFHEYPVLGSVVLEGKQENAATAVFLDLLNFPQDGSLAMCFNPHHALRVTSGGHEYDFLLCYECHRMEIFRDGKEVVARNAKGSPAVLNALLANARIPLAKTNGE